MDTKKGSRRYSDEFKLEALRLLETSGKSATELERELGLSYGLIRTWRIRYKVKDIPNETPVLDKSDNEAAYAEIRRLKRQLAIVEEERDILKKVVNIFSREDE